MPKKSADMDLSNHPNVKARIMPQNFEAEQAVLGCVLIDSDAPVYILYELKSYDFYSSAHSLVFNAMQTVYNRDEPVDFVTLVQELDVTGNLEKVGGVTYITSLTNIVPSAANFKHYCDIVKKTSLLRKLILSSQKIIDKAYSGDADSDALPFAEREIYTLSETQDRSALAEIQPSVSQAIKRIEELSKDPKAFRGIPTGFYGLNALLNGFHSSDLILIAARPGQGKTSIAMNFIEHAAFCTDRKTPAGKTDPFKCAVFSLEMPAVQLARRLLCSVAKVNMTRANAGTVSAEEWQRLFQAKSKLDKAKIYIDDSSLTTPIEILSKCRRLKREQGLDMVMVDYLQLMSSGKRVESRQQEISEITRTMKIAAKELNVPILLLSQMSRDIEKRTDKRPQMSDLRESGAIEQDADIIMFLYRQYDQNDTSVSEAERNKVEIIVAKHRNGETGRVEVRWCGENVRFEDVNLSANVKSLESNIPPEKGFESLGHIIGEMSADELSTDENTQSLSSDALLSVDPGSQDKNPW